MPLPPLLPWLRLLVAAAKALLPASAWLTQRLRLLPGAGAACCACCSAACCKALVLGRLATSLPGSLLQVGCAADCCCCCSCCPEEC